MQKQNACDELLHQRAQELAELVANGEAHKHKVSSLEFRKKQIENQIEHEVKASQKKIYEGLKLCIFSLNECRDLPMDTSALVQELSTCMNSMSVSKLGHSFSSGTSWKDQLGISDKCMEMLFRGAKHLFDNKEYKSSEKAFFVLCTLDSTHFAYWVGLGHSNFQEHHYQQAITAYGMASSLDPASPWPHIWAANTFEREKDFDHAKMALEIALSLEKAKKVKDHQLVQFLEERVQHLKTR